MLKLFSLLVVVALVVVAPTFIDAHPYAHSDLGPDGELTCLVGSFSCTLY